VQQAQDSRMAFRDEVLGMPKIKVFG